MKMDALIFTNENRVFTYFFLDKPLKLEIPLQKDKGTKKGRGKNWIAAFIPRNRCVTFSELIESEIIHKYFPLIKEMSMTVASMGIRNRATMVGNICSAVPSADSAPILLVYDADVIVKQSPAKELKNVSSDPLLRFWINYLFDYALILRNVYMINLTNVTKRNSGLRIKTNVHSYNDAPA